MIAGQPCCDSPFLAVLSALYGGPDSGLLWSIDLCNSLEYNGYKESQYDPCIWTKTDHGKITSVVGFLVDDLIGFFGSSQLIEQLNYKFGKVKVLSSSGDHASFAGINIKRTDSGYALSTPAHEQHALQVPSSVDYSKTMKTPWPTSTVQWEDGPLLAPPQVTEFRSMIGTCSFMANTTRPDISFSVGILSQRTHQVTTQALKLGSRLCKFVGDNPAVLTVESLTVPMSQQAFHFYMDGCNMGPCCGTLQIKNWLCCSSCQQKTETHFRFTHPVEVKETEESCYFIHGS